MTTLLISALVLAVLVMALLPARSGECRVRERQLGDSIDRLLPQTQCGACGYPGCKPYARAIASGEAAINLCPPGGEQTVRTLAILLGRHYRPLRQLAGGPQVAIIDEDTCIGCVKCIHACPVDAIIGAPKQMHTVMAKPCTGCGLCLEPCPVDCIRLVPAPARIKKWVWNKPQPPYLT